LVVCVEDDDGGLAIEEEAATLAAGRRRATAAPRCAHGRGWRHPASLWRRCRSRPPTANGSGSRNETRSKRDAPIWALVHRPATHDPTPTTSVAVFFQKHFKQLSDDDDDSIQLLSQPTNAMSTQKTIFKRILFVDTTVQLLVVSHWAAVGISHSLHHATFNSTFSFYAYDFKNPRARSTFTEMFAANDRKPFQSCFLFYY
jgi:hypothetical protein